MRIEPNIKLVLLILFARMASNKLQEVKNRLYNLEKLKVGTPEHSQLLKDIMDHLKPHIEGEENNDFPKLEKAIGVQGSKEAAASFARTKKFVPTRYAHLCFIIFQLSDIYRHI